MERIRGHHGAMNKEEIEPECGDEGLHDFMNDGKELYSGGDGDGEEMMKKEVRCKNCNKRAIEYYLMIQRVEIEDMYAEILDK